MSIPAGSVTTTGSTNFKSFVSFGEVTSDERVALFGAFGTIVISSF